MSKMMITINRSLKATFPTKDIEAVAGDGYIYFNGDDGFDQIPSLYVDPKSVSAALGVALVITQVREYFSNK